MQSNGKRLSKDDAAVVRQLLAEGKQVVFTDRHQWRHFQVRGS
ncbi:hypothetical protein [Ktedonobacter robiniae]|nr:hypothetical protein [Ktedonobacter robiniae]